MLIYFFPIALSLMTVLFNKTLFDKLAILVLCVLLILRYGVGYDYFNYQRIFEKDISFRFAPLSDILQDFARIIDFPNGFIGICAFLSCLILLYLTKRNAPKSVSLFIFFTIPFFYLESFTIVRQLLAVLVTAISYQMLVSNKKTYCIVAYLLAVFLHPSAVVSLPVFIFTRPSLSFKYMTFVIISIFTFLYAFQYIWNAKIITIYAAEEFTGNYYIIITAGIFVLTLLQKNFDIIFVTFLGLCLAIVIYYMGGYVFNRFLIYFYVPILFINLTSKNLRVSYNKMIFILVSSQLFFAAFHVKLQDVNNGFNTYRTILF